MELPTLAISASVVSSLPLALTRARSPSLDSTKCLPGSLKGSQSPRLVPSRLPPRPVRKVSITKRAWQSIRKSLPHSRWPHCHRFPPEIMSLLEPFFPDNRIPMCRSTGSICHTQASLAWWEDILDGQPTEKLAFLEMIEKDLEDFWLCHICCAFHPSSGYTTTCEYFGSNQAIPARPCQKESSFKAPFAGYQIAFSDVQQVMNRHRHKWQHGGLQLEAVEDFAHSPVKFGGPGFPSACLRKAEPMIENGELLMHIELQYRLMEKHILTRFNGDETTSMIRLCTHDGFLGERTLQDEVLNATVDLGDRQCRSFGLHNRCGFCPAEFQVTEGKNNIITVDLWYNFGSGKTPSHPQWSALCGNGDYQTWLVPYSTSIKGRFKKRETFRKHH